MAGWLYQSNPLRLTRLCAIPDHKNFVVVPGIGTKTVRPPAAIGLLLASQSVTRLV